MNSDSLAARIAKALSPTSSSRAESVPSNPPVIPDHEMIRRIGAGGYGEVWLARSVTGALRAVKVIWRSQFSSERPYEREFHGIVRFEPISRSHPGVVNVLHVGRDDAAGCFFYVMELADSAKEAAGNKESGKLGSDAQSSGPSGDSAACPTASYSPRTLAAELKSRPRLPVMDVVSLGVQLAGALGHLHRHELVHRDVKPSNVIFVNGQAKLADIGLVTGVGEERSFVGTEGYIPPEGPGGEPADLFALGRLLYEAATGKDRCDFPELPEDLDRWPKSEREALIELNEVLARACASDWKKRHGNAADLAGDLNLILAGRSVRRAYRVERQLRRVTLLSAAALVVVLVTIFSNWLQRRQRELSEAHARREAALRAEAERALDRAESAERESRQHLYAALLEQARATVLSGELGQRVRALDAIRRAAAISNSVELRREVLAALALPDLQFERELAFDSSVTQFQFDPSLERVAVGRREGPVEVRAAVDNRVLATLPASTNLPSYHREWSADGRFLAVKRDYPNGGREGDWEVWDMAKQQCAIVVREVHRNAFSFHPRLPRFIAGRAADGATLWDLETRREVARFPSITRAKLLRFSPEGDRFAVVAPKYPGLIVSVHDVNHPEREALATSPVIRENITAVGWHPEGRWLAVPSLGTSIRWMDARSGETGLMGQHKLSAVRAVFSPDGRYLFTGGWEKEIICWDARTKRRKFTISLNSDNLQFSSDGRRCALLTQSSAQLHRFEQPVAHRDFQEDLGGFLRHASFSSDGRWLAASGDKHVGLWDLTDPGPGALVDEGSNTILFFAPDGGEMFGTRSPGNTPACFRWRITPPGARSGNAEAPVLTRVALKKPEGFTSLAVWSNSVVMTGVNGSSLLKISDLDSQRPDWKATHPGISGISPDGKWLGVYESYGTALHIYRLPSLELAATLPHPASFSYVMFSPLGDQVAIGSLGSSSSLEFWKTATWERARVMTNFGRVLFQPDARALWLTKDQSSAGLYDARTLKPLLLLPKGMLPLALSPDGLRLAVSVDGRRLQMWNLAELRDRLRGLGLDWQ